MTEFQFSFNPIYKKFVRELKDDESNPIPIIIILTIVQNR